MDPNIQSPVLMNVIVFGSVSSNSKSKIIPHLFCANSEIIDSGQQKTGPIWSIEYKIKGTG